MDYLIIGSGGREHAIAWAMCQTDRVYVCPGNPGMEDVAAIAKIQSDPQSVASFALEHDIHAVIIGPEAPLCSGMSDFLRAKGINVFGPSMQAAQLEGSKGFAKDFMARHGIPTAQSQTFDNANEALNFLRSHDFPLVIKVDGLAAGKGVHITEDLREAEIVINAILSENAFGEAGRRVVIEEFQVGRELSMLILTDGKTFVPLSPSRDHKQLEDGNKGPMTGGMGAFTPVPDLDSFTYNRIISEVVKPSIEGLGKDCFDYRGVLYCGLMLTKTGPKVLEYNCRFGDPEAEVVIPMIKTPFAEIVDAVAQRELSKVKVEFNQGFAACVVLASEGYPNKPITGRTIHGIDKAREMRGGLLFASGVGKQDDHFITLGGRVLTCVGMANTLRLALGRAYAMTRVVGFEGMQMRGDIGGRYARGRTTIMAVRRGRM
jgi:phosphoribosylamine---glycine ligase